MPLSGSGAMHLIWDPVPEPRLAGYNLHYGSERGIYTGCQDIGNITEAVLTGLNPDNSITARSPPMIRSASRASSPTN